MESDFVLNYLPLAADVKVSSLQHFELIWRDRVSNLVIVTARAAAHDVFRSHYC